MFSTRYFQLLAVFSVILAMYKSVPLMHHDPHRSWITDSDYLKGTQPKIVKPQGAHTILPSRERVNKGTKRMNSVPLSVVVIS